MNVVEVLEELRAEANAPCDNCDTPEKKALFTKHPCPECDGKGVATLVTVDREDLIAVLDAASPLRSTKGLTKRERARDRIALAIVKVRCARDDLRKADGTGAGYWTCESILLLLRDLQRNQS